MHKSFVRKRTEDHNEIRNTKSINKSIQQGKLKHQNTQGNSRNDCNISKSRSVSTKLNKTKSQSVEPAKSKKQGKERNSVTTKIGPTKLKKRKGVGHYVTTNSRNIKKTISGLIDLPKTEHEKLSSVSVCKLEATEFPFKHSLLKLPFACGDYCFEQKETDQDKLRILYKNYSHTNEEKLINMDSGEVEETPKETVDEKPEEDAIGGEEENVEPPPLPEEGGELTETELPPDTTLPDPDEEAATTDKAQELEGENPDEGEPGKDESGDSETGKDKPGDSETLKGKLGQDEKITESDKEQESKQPKKVSFDSNIPHTDSKIQEELQAARTRGILTTKAIEELQKSVYELTQKDQVTPEEAAHLQKTQTELLSKLSEFEQLTRHVARMIKMTEVPSSQLDMGIPFRRVPGVPSLPQAEKDKPPVPPKQLPPQKQFSEEKLPKIIVCGNGADDNVPKIIVCEPMKDCDTQPFPETKIPDKSPDGNGGHSAEKHEVKEPPKRLELNNDILKDLLERVDKCYSAQQKMFADNMLLEKSRYELQTEVLRKDQIVEDLQKMVNKLCKEVERVSQENIELKQKYLVSSQPPSPPMCRKQLCETFAMKSDQLGSGGETDEVREPAVKPPGDAGEQDFWTTGDERYQRKQNGELSSFWGQVPVCKLMLPAKATQTDQSEFEPVFMSEADPDYRTLQEQYCRIKSDYRNKITEVSTLRNGLITLKQESDKQFQLLNETETMLQDLLESNKCLETEKQKLLLFRDQYVDVEQQLNLAKLKLRDFEEEGEDARHVLADYKSQLDSYRTKYLCISQAFEELKQDMNQKIKEHSEKLDAAELQMKAKEEEYLEEVMGLNTLLNDAKIQLDNTLHMHSIALDNVTEMSKKIQGLTIENDQLKEQLYNLSNEEKMNELSSNLTATEKKLEEVQLENASLRLLTTRLEAMQSENNRRFEEKSHENSQLVTQLDTLREESARQVARVKDRCEVAKQNMASQISEMETELIQSRAALCAAKKERDEIRQKMQLQIMNLNDTLNESQAHIQQLLNHVTYLKTSHTEFLIAGGGNLCSSLLNDEEKASIKTRKGS